MKPKNATIKRRKRAGQSQALFEKAAKQRERSPLLVRNVNLKTRLTVVPAKVLSAAGKVIVEERYQRARIDREVSDLVYVLKSGGIIPDPVSLALRPDGVMAVLDGQQRYWAYYDTSTDMPAILYEVSTFEQERELFLVLNTSVRVSPASIIHAHPGATAALVRQWSEDHGSPLRGLVEFSRGHLPFRAAVLAQAVAAAIGSKIGGQVVQQLALTDNLLRKSSRNREIVSAIPKLLAAVCGLDHKSRPRPICVLALCRVAGRRWAKAGIGEDIPGSRLLPQLRALMQDQNIVPTNAVKFLPTVEAEIERRWKAAA